MDSPNQELSTMFIDMNGYLYDIRRPGKNIAGFRAGFGGKIGGILVENDLEIQEIFNRMAGRNFDPYHEEGEE